MHWFNVAWHWFEIKSGTQPLKPNPYYNFWSGPGSDLGEVAIVGGLVQIYRQHNCHVKGCARLGKHEYDKDGVKFKLCRKHHPAVDHKHRVTADEFAVHHANGHAKATVTEVVKERRGPVRDARGRFVSHD